MARPGTIDYSKWELLAADISSDEDAPGLPSPPAWNPPRGATSTSVDEDEELSDDQDEAFSDDEEWDLPVKRRCLRTGTCAHCGSEGAEKRCSRCQEAWFCGLACQSAAWRSHAIVCAAKSETEAWWGKLGPRPAAGPGGSGDRLAAHEERLVYRRAVAATYDRRQAAAEAAARASAQRAREGQQKGASGAGKGGKGAEEEEETCAVCQCEFTVKGDSGDSLCCPSSHFLCSECTGVFVQSIFNDLEASYPAKCSMCRAEIPSETFERQLNSKQRARLCEFVSLKSLASSEQMVVCPCGYSEIRADRPVLWWCEVCKRGECQVCNKELPRATGSLFSAGSSGRSDVEERNLLLQPHVIGCAALRDAKEKVDRAFEQGQKMPCPGCGLAGMKDEACTHMNCLRCQASWCYLCGLSVGDCDKALPRAGRPANDIYLHNQDWEINPRRCPMFLTQILEVDPAWLGQNWDAGDEVDDAQCLSYFHRWRTIKLIQEALDEIGTETFEKLWLHFDTFRNSGYELEEIYHTDTSVLIDREGWEGGASDASLEDSEGEVGDPEDGHVDM